MPSEIYGKNTVLNAALSEREFYEVFVVSQNLNECEQILKYADKKYVKINILSTKQMDIKFPKYKHQGIVAVVEDYKYTALEDVLKDNDNPFLVILDGLEDPHNLGAILRSADAVNADCIIIPKNGAVGITATVAKVSTGAIEYVPIVQVTNIARTIDKIKDYGIWVVGADINGNMLYNDIDGKMRIAIVIGSEGKGMRRLVREKCDFLVRIPMSGNVNSLNASVSAALMMYQVYNDRQK